MCCRDYFQTHYTKHVSNINFSVREISVLLAFGHCNKASLVPFSIYTIMKKCDVLKAIGQFLGAWGKR